jgi:CHAD domain-containing protein
MDFGTQARRHFFCAPHSVLFKQGCNMTAHVRATESGTKGVRRLARKQINKAFAALNEPETGNLPRQRLAGEVVHDVRKRLKKVRAYLRLLRPALGAGTYGRENAEMRDAATPLTEIRDAKVLVDTFDKLMEKFGGELDGPALGGVRRLLVSNQDETRRRLWARGDLGRVTAALQEARARSKRWRVGRSGWSVLGRGLKRVYRQGRDALAASQRDRSIANLHECRKQAKYLWHGLEVLEPLGPVVLHEFTSQAHDLADYLGDDHDLAVLRQRLQEVTSQFPDLAATAALMAVINRRRQELQEQAFTLGRLLYHQKPKNFTAHLEAYWQAWRSEQTASRAKKEEIGGRR